MNKSKWVREMSEIDPSMAGDLDMLWDQLQEEPDFNLEDTSRRIWIRLSRARSPFWTYVCAWRISWTLFTVRRVGILMMGPVMAVLATWLVPLHHYIAFAWWGLVAPWAGLLAAPVLSLRNESSAWGEWETAAPLDPGLRVAADWVVIMMVTAVVAGLGSGLVAEPASRLHVFMMWLGPFGLTSIGTVLLTRKLGSLWSVVLASVFWGSQTLLGWITLLHRGALGLLWFANVQAPLWPNLTALACGVMLAMYLARRGWRTWNCN